MSLLLLVYYFQGILVDLWHCVKLAWLGYFAQLDLFLYLLLLLFLTLPLRLLFKVANTFPSCIRLIEGLSAAVLPLELLLNKHLDFIDVCLYLGYAGY